MATLLSTTSCVLALHVEAEQNDRPLYICEDDGVEYLFTPNNGRYVLEESTATKDDGTFHGRDVPLKMYKNPPGFSKLGGTENNPVLETLAPNQGIGWKIVAELDIPTGVCDSYPSFRQIERPDGLKFWVKIPPGSSFSNVNEQSKGTTEKTATKSVASVLPKTANTVTINAAISAMVTFIGCGALAVSKRKNPV